MHVNKITIKDWITFFKEVVLLFNHLGYAFGKAFSDLQLKIDIILKNDKFWAEKGVNLVYVQDVIEFEIS